MIALFVYKNGTPIGLVNHIEVPEATYIREQFGDWMNFQRISCSPPIYLEVDQAAKTYEQLEQRIKELEQALAPFADYADTWPATDEPFHTDGVCYTDTYEFGYRFRNDNSERVMMTLGQYREARRVLGRKPAQNQGES